MAKAKKESLKDRLKKKKKELKERSRGGNIIYQKEGTMRVRLLPTGEDNDFVFEVIQFYLGGEIKGVYSPATVGKPCAIMEKYEELKESDDPDDKELAKKFSPKRKYLAPVLVYTDSKGKKVDTEKSGKLIQLSNGQYQEIIDHYLDVDEWGDMTDSKKGYDIKLGRSGTTLTDTDYNMSPCKNTPIPKAWAKEVDLEAMVLAALPSYEETLEAINSFLNMGGDDDEKPVRKKKTVKKKVSSKKKRSPDL
jgi:hypothetical protein